MLLTYIWYIIWYMHWQNQVKDWLTQLFSTNPTTAPHSAVKPTDCLWWFLGHMLSLGLLCENALLIHTHTAWEALQVHSWLLHVCISTCWKTCIRSIFGLFSLIGYFSSHGPFVDSSVFSHHLTEESVTGKSLNCHKIWKSGPTQSSRPCSHRAGKWFSS